MNIQLRWVPVSGPDGRQRMEMRWTALQTEGQTVEPEHVLAA